MAGDGEAVGLGATAESLVRVGSVGVAVELISAEFAPRQAPGSGGAFDSFGDEIGLAIVRPTHRFEIVEVCRHTSAYPRRSTALTHPTTQDSFRTEPTRDGHIPVPNPNRHRNPHR